MNDLEKIKYVYEWIGENGEVKEMINNHPETTEIINNANLLFFTQTPNCMGYKKSGRFWDVRTAVCC